MQKSIKVVAASALSFLIISSAQAQDSHTGPIAQTVTKNINVFEKNVVPMSNSESVATNQIVAAKFSTMFPLATNSQWSNAKGDVWVSFENNGRKSRASFTPGGKVNYIISNCSMEQLPGAFSKTIKKGYASYSLFNAIEIQAHGTLAYQVVLENQVSFITLKYTSDGVEEVQKVNKTAK